jgi:D-glycero-D-manno-heptose 1,7-bisphosphate phosphatase
MKPVKLKRFPEDEASGSLPLKLGEPQTMSATSRQGELLPPGIWCTVEPVVPDLPLRAGVILDRDGVLVEEVHYLSDPASVRLERGAADFLRAAAARGIPVAVATNQSGIDRGYFGWDAYHTVAARLADLLRESGVAVAGTAACPFHPDHTPDYGSKHEHWRKPGPGLLVLLAERLRLDLSRTWMIGDKAADLVAAKTAGMAGGVHVATGHGRAERTKALALADERFAVETAGCLGDAVSILDRIA